MEDWDVPGDKLYICVDFLTNYHSIAIDLDYTYLQSRFLSQYPRCFSEDLTPGKLPLLVELVAVLYGH
jgi:hypothetical protein